MADVPHLSTRCPFCGDKVSMIPASPNHAIGQHRLGNMQGPGEIQIAMHKCTNTDCPGATVAYYNAQAGPLQYVWHVPRFRQHSVDESVPARARQLLQEANDAKQTPAACVMTASRAIEAMLAEEGFNNRKHSLKKRIDQAVEARLLAKVMGDWAHEVREFAREGHTDQDPQDLPDKDDAEHVLAYANTLAEYLYVLPSRFKKVGGEDE